MATNILMPALSPTMEEGTLAKWHVREGDEVKAGDILAEIETDKATMEFEAIDDGRIGKILVGEGAEGIKVNDPIAVLLEEGDSADERDRKGNQLGSQSAGAGSAKREAVHERRQKRHGRTHFCLASGQTHRRAKRDRFGWRKRLRSARKNC
jgi:pyruvate/2-oxoglutarate dehydrogenase complex dihydrolipoamide acyltransferase (E2) component